MLEKQNETLGPSGRNLIVNADDFGLSPGVNRGIIHTHEHGIVTSASLMVLKPAASEAAEYARAHPELSVGLHVDLCEWSYANADWKVLYELVPMNNPTAVQKEVRNQLDKFQSLMGRNPTHLDSHQHVHRDEPLRSILLREAARMEVPVRSLDPIISYCGDFYGQADKGHPYPEGISVEGLLNVLRSLPRGTTELGCHPGLGDEHESMYNHERHMECQALCHPQVQSALKEFKIRLCSFHDRKTVGPPSQSQ